jgi:hypothetical protein
MYRVRCVSGHYMVAVRWRLLVQRSSFGVFSSRFALSGLRSDLFRRGLAAHRHPHSWHLHLRQ